MSLGSPASRSALRVGLVYLAFAFVLALLGDRALGLLGEEPQERINLHVAEDWTVAAATSLIIYLLLRRELSREQQAQDALRRSRDEFETRVQERTAELSGANAVLQTLAVEAVHREDALRRERQRLTGILDAIADDVYIADKDFHVEYVNPAITSVLGPVNGRLCYEYLHERKSPCPWCQSGEVLAGRTVRQSWYSARSGKSYDSVGTPVYNQDGSVSRLQISRDVTEREQTQQERERRALELAGLLDISRAVSSTLELQSLVSIILDQLKVMVDYTGAAVFFPQDDRIFLFDYKGPLPDEQVRGFSAPLVQMLLYERAVEQKRPVIIADILSDDQFARQYREMAPEMVRQTLGASRSVMGIPLMLNERVIGLLRLDHLEPDHFTAHDAQLALAIANQATVAIENARLYEEVKETSALRERQRLARELHDSVSQVSTASPWARTRRA